MTTTKRPTITDVALQSGVSKTTVSYVINNGPRGVDPETKARVLAAVERLQYHPSTMARGLSQKPLDCLGVVFPKPDQRLVVDSYFSAILDGIVSVATSQNQNVMLYTGLEWKGRASMPAFLDRRVDGFLLIATDTDSGIVAALADAGLPFVLISDTVGDARVTSIDIDNVDAAQKVVDHLAALGHRRIVMLSGEANSPSSLPRQQGFLLGLEKHGLPAGPDRVIAGFYSREWGRDRALELLRRPDPPTAIFAGGDGIAMGVYDACEQLGVRIPKQLSVVGFDDAPFASYMHPSLTTMRQPLQQIGERAATILLSQLKSPDEQPAERIILSADLIARKSTAPPRGGPIVFPLEVVGAASQ